ncbi:hypothetical protein lerEdw1_012241 [Lerista edwardsae]|nr:hypothetical protein lerEdw1_012241 [Lerista edwardsae]
MTTANKTPPGADPKQLERTGTVREIGSQAVWSLSSCKPGFGVDQLRDDNLETYWQSDGSQPHLVNIQFRRKTTVKTLCIYADYKSDESYTPSKISVRVGNNFHNLQEIRATLAVSSILAFSKKRQHTTSLTEYLSETEHHLSFDTAVIIGNVSWDYAWTEMASHFVPPLIGHEVGIYFGEEEHDFMSKIKTQRSLMALAAAIVFSQNVPEH